MESIYTFQMKEINSAKRPRINRQSDIWNYHEKTVTLTNKVYILY